MTRSSFYNLSTRTNGKLKKKQKRGFKMSNYLIKPEIFTKKMNILIYGDPGAGKTHLAGTAQDHPGMANVHVFNIDGGMMTLAQRGDIRASDVTSLEQLELELYKIADKDPEYEGVNTIVIDNITELQTLNLESIIRDEIKKSKKDKTSKRESLDEIWMDDYGKSTKQIARILRGFRDLPLHKIYIAHRMDKLRKGTQTVDETKPSLTNKLGTAVAGYMDFVWYLYTDTVLEIDSAGNDVGKMHRFLLTQPYEHFLAKTRGEAFADGLGIVIQDPNLAQIYETYLKVSGLQE
jgi:hypothetical protein